MNYIGHGSGTSWASLNSGEYQSEDIQGIQAQVRRPVIIDVSCQNGRFKNEGRLGERFQNEHIGNIPIGAVAYYGGSVDISWHPPAKMAVLIAQLVAQKNIPTLGQLLLAGQLKLLKDNASVKEVKDNFTWYHLLGDPTMRLPWAK